MKSEFVELDHMLSTIEKKYSNETFPGMMAAAYVMLLAKQGNVLDIENLSKFLSCESNEIIKGFVFERLGNHWNDYRKYLTAFDENVLRNYILRSEYNNCRSFWWEHCSTPDFLIDLIIKIFKISNSDKIADFGVGSGEFLVKVQKNYPETFLYGNDISTAACAIAMMRSKLAGDNIVIKQEDIFFNHKSLPMFDKIFCNPPWGMRLRMMPSVKEFLNNLPPSLPTIKGSGAAEWIFALKIMESLKAGGMAAMIMTDGAMFNNTDRVIRKYFVERKMIKAVISLPAKIFRYSLVKANLVIFQKDNTDTNIRFIDASGFGTNKRNSIEFSEDDINNIIAQLNGEDAPTCINKDYRDIILENSVLCAERYLITPVELEDQAPFGSVIKNINRGAALTSRELDDLVSDTPTQYQYLMLSNIQNGFITENLPYLKNIDERLKHYCIHDRDIILSKIGAPFKIALAEEGPCEILGNGNIFIITIDRTKAEPAYIKAFLESEKGMALLRNIAIGTTVPNITVGALKDMPISLPPMEKQHEIAVKYMAKTDEIAMLKRKLDKAIDDLSHLLN